MAWLAYALLSVFLFSITSLFQKVLMKDEQSDAHTYSIVFQIIGAAIVTIIAAINGFVMPPITQYPINFFLLAALYGLGTLCVFNAFKYIEASEVTIISSTRAIVVITSAILLLGENFSILKGIGTMLILLAAYLVSSKLGKIKFNKGFLYAIGIAIFYGLATTNDAYLIPHVDVISFLAIGFLLPGIFLIAVKPNALLKVHKFLEVKVFSKMLLLTIFYAGGAVTFYYALASGADASQLSPISQSSVITTVILSAVILKERDNIYKKLLAAIFVIAGVLLIK